MKDEITPTSLVAAIADSTFVKCIGGVCRIAVIGRMLFAITAFAAAAAGAIAAEPQAPSQVAKARSGKPVTFVLVESRDLRLLFCTFEVLKARQQKGVCVVDEISGGPIEVSIAPGESVREVLKKIGKEKIKSQLRLVTENAIEQTPLSLPLNHAEEFLSRRVNPGDILILAAQT